LQHRSPQPNRQQQPTGADDADPSSVSDEVDASASATEPVEGKLQLYFDTRAAAVADRTELHRRELETADALIVVVTPGLLFEASINLGWADSGEPIPINYLHEVGHTLGLVHETSNPNAALRWNKTKVYGDLAGPPNFWSKSQVDAAIFTSEPYPGQRAFDRDSIMLYSFPGDYFMDGKPLVRGKVLSQSDKRFIAQLYPGR
jgi:hypothetical protein